MAFVQKTSVVEQIHSDLRRCIDGFGPHPFAHGITHTNAQKVLAEYRAMSETFPLIQAGSQRDLVFDAIRTGNGISEDVEYTTVVGNFLAWDETGGNYVLREHGIQGLPRILDTSQYFHARLLESDLRAIFGGEPKPSYSAVTQAYLFCLYDGLASRNAVTRCAYMVAFEAHAEWMIKTLWQRLSELYPSLDKETLVYFRTHVGGDDPAEAYHVAMTTQMIERIVSEDHVEAFRSVFESAYRLNWEWCRDICRIVA